MTGFSRKTQETTFGQLTWEVRSVNHRYLDLQVRLPEALRDLENEVREMARTFLQRGKIEVMLSFQPNATHDTHLQLNDPLVAQLTTVLQKLKPHFPNSEVQLLELLRWPGVLASSQDPSAAIDAIEEKALGLLSECFQDLLLMRQREGEATLRMIEQRLLLISDHVQQLLEDWPQLQNERHEQLKTKMTEWNLNLNAERLEQEVLLYSQKTDIAEELERLESHIEETRRTLYMEGPAGKRLDFIFQEMNREANTMASKAVHFQTTQSALEIKVAIEQMREQIQNIE